MTNSNTNHNHKQLKLNCKQQILIGIGRCTITDYIHTKLV